jgi:hypothetical protein
MALGKIEVTQKHIKAIEKIAKHFGSVAKLCDFLKISNANGFAWKEGLRVMALVHAETLHNAKVMDFLEIRPDMKRYAKYYKNS